MTREDFPFGGETPLTAGVNAVLDALEGTAPDYPFGRETPLTAGFNAIISRVDLLVRGYELTDADKAEIAALVREGMADGDAAEW